MDKLHPLPTPEIARRMHDRLELAKTVPRRPSCDEEFLGMLARDTCDGDGDGDR